MQKKHLDILQPIHLNELFSLCSLNGEANIFKCLVLFCYSPELHQIYNEIKQRKAVCSFLKVKASLLDM